MPDTSFEDRVRSTLREQADKQLFDPFTVKPAAKIARRRLERTAVVAGLFAIIAILGLIRIGDSSRGRSIPATTPTPSVVPLGDQIIAFVDGSQVKTIRADGSHEALLVTPCTSTPCNIDGIAWSPTGSELAIGLSRRLDRGHTAIVRGDGSGLRTLTDCPGGVPVWSPDGSRIAPGNTGGPERLYACDADGGGIRQMSPGWFPMDWGPAAWSQDGRQLAYSAKTPSGVDAIIVESADGTGARQIFQAGDQFGWLSGPIWSPDGRRFAVAYWPKRHGTSQLWLVNADGTHPHVVLEARWVRGAAWSPDGTQLAVVAPDPLSPTTPSLILMAADGSGQTQLLEGGFFSIPAWDPSGRALALVHDHELVIVPVDGSPVRTVAADVTMTGLAPIAWAQ